MDVLETEKIWDGVKTELFKEVPESSYAWINSLEPTGYANGVFTVVTALSMAVTIIRSSYLKQIKEIFKRQTGNSVDFEIVFDKQTAESIKREKNKRNIRISVRNIEPEDNSKNMEHLMQMHSGANLNLKYKFENFVVGSNSKTAYAIANIVAQHPAQKYNPFFIYGGSGLGKTHLMQAIGHYTIFNLSGKKVKYIKTQDFVNQYINNMGRNDTKDLMIRFRQKFRNVDVLLIDDIQFIELKKKCMDELFYILETLMQLNKQIVLTSDRLPKDIQKLPDRLRTRFEMGIVVDIKPPSYETRVAILHKWGIDHRLMLKDEVCDYIAGHFTNNVRELEGAFNKVTALAEIENTEITLDFVQEVLKNDTQLKKITIQNIAQTVAEYFNITIDNLKSPARAQNISDARKYTIYLAREMTKMSYEEIAKFLNKKHTTMLYSYEKILETADRNTEVKELLRELKQAIKCNA